MIKNWIKQITGISDLEHRVTEAESARKLADERAAEARKEAEIIERRMLEEKRIRAEEEKKQAEAKLTPKERATKKKEPWVGVLDTHVNKDNIRNGFFELDWNDLFILELKKAGYGFDGDPDEEIVDRWFRDLARNMFEDQGLDPTRGAGFINVTPLGQDKTEIS